VGQQQGQKTAGWERLIERPDLSAAGNIRHLFVSQKNLAQK
jgi:hypothetical protein